MWDAFLRTGPRAAYGTAAAWGRPRFLDSPFMLTPYGRGWHVDRPRFDALLAERARLRGATVRLGTRVVDTTRVEDGWLLRLARGEALTARFLVDASGRRAAIARRLGARVVAADRLIGFARFFDVEDDRESVTLVEPFREGWWYTAGLPQRRRIVACMTDADIAARLGLLRGERWRELLEETARVGRTVTAGTPQGALVARSAASQRLDPACGEGWIAVGDAASTFDPLSSQGILKALRSGIFASYAVADRLSRGDAAGLERYRRYITREAMAHRRAQAKYYREERRWPQSQFWSRRHDDTGVALRPALA